MKAIYNWQYATVSDIEANALLDDATLIHVLYYQLQDGKSGDIKGEEKERVVRFFNHHIEKEIPIIMHNGIGYDIPLVEKLLGLDLSRLMIIDTLVLSWYLNPKRKSHSLDSFFPDYGIAKPKIDDWEGLSYDEYMNRCRVDTKINLALWQDLKARLISMYTTSQKEIRGSTKFSNKLKKPSTEEVINNLLTFLMFKMDVARLKESTGFKADRQWIESGIGDLNSMVEASKLELEAVMPKVPRYAIKNKPKNLYKKDGTLSIYGQNWDKTLNLIGVVDDYGNPLVEIEEGSVDRVKVLSGLENPKISSPDQIKKLLYSKGWTPINFKYVKDKELTRLWADSGFKKELKPIPRKVPQVSVDGEGGKELCPSVLRLADKFPEIMAYAKYTTVKHRLDMLKGFIRDMKGGDYLIAGVGGVTNTLRERHRGLVNLPGTGKPYGEAIRGSLTCLQGESLVGSDMSALEDRVKHHFMLPYDPKYVAEMSEQGYDPHLAMAVVAGLITKQDMLDYKAGKKSDSVKASRSIAKSVNYALVYGSGAETLAITSGVSVKQAKELITAYWKLNWAVKAIADDQVVIEDEGGQKWLVNPINGFCYSLRKESDRFSTLCQGSGSFFFDVWVDKYLTLMHQRFGVKRLAATFHDELVHAFKDSEKNRLIVTDMLKQAITLVNQEFSLNRELDVDIQFGKRYSEIH